MNELAVLLVAMMAGKKTTNQMRVAEVEEENYVISSEEALRFMKNNKGYAVVDVRMPEEYSAGHIPGAINIPLETIINEPLKELPNLNQVILVYCHGGSRSRKAGMRLVRIGYTKVYCFGGIDTWTGSIVK